MENLKSKIKNMKGITLIVLVVTIIVLIILAGITANLLLGENGLINKTKLAKEENDKATAKETMNLKITNVQILKYAQEQRMPTLKELADNFCEDDDFQYVQETSEVASLTKITNNNPTSIFTKLKAYPYEFEINSSLQLASIDGVQVATSEVPAGYVSQSDYNALLARVVALENNSNSQPSSSVTNNNYSATEEQIVGTWTNGKNIYRKVYNISENISSYSNIRYIRKTVESNVDEIIDCGGYFVLDSKKKSFPSSEGNWDSVPSFHGYAQVSNDNSLEVYILYKSENYNDNPITGKIWIEYTKTDTTPTE